MRQDVCLILSRLDLSAWLGARTSALFATLMAAVLCAGLAGPALAAAENGDDPHGAVFDEEAYPSASQCKACHEQIYWEWSSSNHAYASISPMFHKFEQAINDLSSGTIGSFCVRCHQQVGTQRGEKRAAPLWERSRVASEGITCITCHRVSQAYGKVNGERNIEPGDIHKPMYSTRRTSNIDEVLNNADFWKVDPTGDGRGNKIHKGVVKFEQLGKSEFCASCHQVAVNLGIKLEVVWEQYRDSPAAAAGVTCQECHMGAVPGKANGYEQAYVAVVNGKPVGKKREHHNHAFYGPGYPIAHPGVFPHNPEAERWSFQEWLNFNYRSSWGMDEFEEMVEAAMDGMGDLNDALDDVAAAVSGGGTTDLDALNEAVGALAGSVDASPEKDAKEAYEALGITVQVLAKTVEAGKAKPAQVDTVRRAATILKAGLALSFPEEWADADDRIEAREVIDQNLELLEEKRELRRQVMENGSRLDGPFFASEPKAGQSFSFSYKITNTDDGHNLPSGSLGAQPEIWLNVAVVDPDGETVFESGYVDSNGDMADLHSLDVAAGTIAHDDQLFNLQTKFLTTNVKGTDREMYLPVNFDVDQLPFLRPAAVPTTVLNHPPFVRMEGSSLPPLGNRYAKYKVPASVMSKPGTYRLAVRLRSRAEPIYFMRFVGATTDMEQAMNQWMIDIHPYTVEFEVK